MKPSKKLKSLFDWSVSSRVCWVWDAYIRVLAGGRDSVLS